MRSVTRYFILFLVAAGLGFIVVIWQLPSFIMTKLMDRVTEQSEGGRLASPLPDDKARSIVLPSPDLAYVICIYDLSKGPLTVSFNPPDLPYWSVAAYADNTDNFAVVNDRNAGEMRSLVLVSPSQPTPLPVPDRRTVQAPSDRGVVLFRGLMPNRDTALLKQVQSSVTCNKP